MTGIWERDGKVAEQKTIIKAVKYFEKGFYAQGLAFGGEDGAEHFDNNVRYRGSLQNYVIDTGDDVILVDTGLPKEPPRRRMGRKGRHPSGPVD